MRNRPIKTEVNKAAFWLGLAAQYTREAAKATTPAERAKWEHKAHQIHHLNHHLP